MYFWILSVCLYFLRLALIWSNEQCASGSLYILLGFFVCFLVNTCIAFYYTCIKAEEFIVPHQVKAHHFTNEYHFYKIMKSQWQRLWAVCILCTDEYRSEHITVLQLFLCVFKRVRAVRHRAEGDWKWGNTKKRMCLYRESLMITHCYGEACTDIKAHWVSGLSDCKSRRDNLLGC